MNEPTTGSTTREPTRILLVEDNRAANRGLARYLEAQGYEVRAVTDGASALEALRAGPPPNYLLTDLQLPDLNGLDVVREARQLAPPPRVAVITGWDIDPLLEDTDRLGVEWVFTKPLDVQDLLAKLRTPAPPADGSG